MNWRSPGADRHGLSNSLAAIFCCGGVATTTPFDPEAFFRTEQHSRRSYGSGLGIIVWRQASKNGPGEDFKDKERQSGGKESEEKERDEEGRGQLQLFAGQVRTSFDVAFITASE